MAVATQSATRTGDDLSKWTRLAERLAHESNHYGAISGGITNAIATLQKHTQDMHDCSSGSQALPPVERMSHIVWQEQESLAGHIPSIDDPVWTSVQAGVYANSFPSVENLGDINDVAIIEFCNSCTG